MGSPFGTGFRQWLESSARDAVLGVISGGQRDLGPEEASHLMSRKTTDFSGSIRSRIKRLGAVRSAAGRNSMSAIARSIDDGILVSDLIDRLVKEGAYESDMDALGRFSDVRLAIARQSPLYMGNRESFVRHLVGKGISEDEANKRADALFGPTGRNPP